MNKEQILQRTMKIAEEFFGTQTDPNQIPITFETVKKLNNLSKSWYEYELNNKEEPISWVVLVPTQKEIAEKFLNNQITERQILDLTKKQNVYNALYLCSAFTVPEERGKGLATNLFKRAIKNIPLTPDAFVFAWPFSEDGLKMLDNNSNLGGRNILIKKSS
jgi:hypothetical protein